MAQTRIQVAGRQVEVGDALRGRIQQELSDGIGKYFEGSWDGVVTVGREGHGFDVEVALHLASGMHLQAHGFGTDAHPAFDDALIKIEKRVRRYKRRLKDHHGAQRALPVEPAAYATIAGPEPDDAEVADAPAGDAPMVIAETTARVVTMPVSTAVLQLELTEAPALLFRNSAHGELNMVYRRPDGNIGWIDPKRAAA
jgi:ribosomal subunit interface protein